MHQGFEEKGVAVKFVAQKIPSHAAINLDVLKLVLMVEVVIGHLVAFSLPASSALSFFEPSGFFYLAVKAVTCFGREAAYSFIFLSGYFTAPSIFKDDVGFGSVLKRLNRLYPTILLALFLTLILDFFGAHVFVFDVYKNNPFYTDIYSHLNYVIFFANAFSLQPNLSVTFGSNGPIWTLGFLVQFYVAAVFVRSASKGRVVPGTIFFVAACVAFCVISVESLVLFFVWSAGAAYRYFDFKAHGIRFFELFFVFVCLVFAKISSPFVSALAVIPICIVLVRFCMVLNKSLGWKIEKAVSSLSEKSFLIYAIHMPISFFVFGAVSEFKAVGFTAAWLLILSLSYLAASFFLAFERKIVRGE